MYTYTCIRIYMYTYTCHNLFGRDINFKVNSWLMSPRCYDRCTADESSPMIDALMMNPHLWWMRGSSSSQPGQPLHCSLQLWKCQVQTGAPWREKQHVTRIENTVQFRWVGFFWSNVSKVTCLQDHSLRLFVCQIVKCVVCLYIVSLWGGKGS